MIGIQHNQQETLVHVISILNVSRYTTQVNRQHINIVKNAVEKTHKDINMVKNAAEKIHQDITTVCNFTHSLYSSLSYQQIVLHIHCNLTNIRD